MRAEVEFKIRNDENKRIIFAYERNINTFLTADPTQPDTRSFRETVFQLTFLVRFGR